MRALLLAVFALLLLAFCVPAAPAAAQTKDGDATAPAVKHPARHKARRSQVRAQGQIACTEFGCHRIPPNCHPTTAYYWNGIPTGYDAVACR